MQALILAAGMAERLRPITLDHPKCLVEIGKKTFIERMVSNILSYGITDINIITGFQVDKIKEFLKEKFPNQTFHFYHNDRYFETNNCYSLWLAKYLIKDNFLLFDADIIFDVRILAKLLDSPYENCLALRKSDDLSEEEMKIKIDGNSKILEINKTMSPNEAIGESLGIEKFSKDLGQVLFSKLEENILVHKKENDFYEKTFEDLTQNGSQIYAVDVEGLACAEVDFVEDIHHVEKNVLPYIEPKEIY